ncbi:MAG TPA: hypothetical protein VMT94_01425 [Burkholderiales bacterium]|nr:hypothetical protein [Burkholderiales bacterium]
MDEILEYLKSKGEQLETEIVAGTGMSPAEVRLGISKLSARGDLVMCRVVRLQDGKQIEGMLYRAAGYVPRPKPGRKPAAAANK